MPELSVMDKTSGVSTLKVNNPNSQPRQINRPAQSKNNQNGAH